IWCSFSSETKLIIYSNILEKDVAIFNPAQSIDSSEIGYTNDKELKGIENVTWMPSGQLLTVTGFNEMIVLLNHVTWKSFLQLYLEPVIKENYLNKVYEERIIQPKLSKFSFCGKYLAIKHQLYPTTLWIWNITEDYFDYLLLENAIVAAKWNPTRAQLLIFCECAHMFEWTPHSANCIPTPRNIVVLDARWHPGGNLLLLCGYNKALIYQLENKL
ncbi:hypothetical protein WH47_10051, partial [Habropoda laboriosa]